MLRKVLYAILTVLTLSAIAQERRLALIIGNSEYKNSGVLKNPVNDARLIAKTLSDLGFEVIKKENASKVEMETSIYEYSKLLKDYNVALFYYAGHGIQVNGVNYLLPVDAKLEDKLAAQFEAVDVSKVVSQFERYPDNVNIVILDACRNDPFKTWSRGGESGFNAMPAPSGTIIAFATSAGATASDGDGGNGLYTSVLSEQMKQPQRIEDVFIQTRVEVRDLSNNAQNPQEWSQLTGKFYFNGNSESEADDFDNQLQEVAANIPKSDPNKPMTLDRGQMGSAFKARVHIEDVLKSGVSVTQLLDMGAPLKYLYGVPYQGGMIFDINEDSNLGYVMMTFDQGRGAEVPWQKAVESCQKLVFEGYDDWVLPNKDQLITMYQNLKQEGIGDFMLDTYWSSSKSGYSNAWGLSFESGKTYDFDKYSNHYVRAIRSFPLDQAIFR
ncbi:caspase family protein [Marinoscillum sp. MHG1-6]|uniref:caspase family protein n=1 Tax=Marinoscillum sp. MHG1-6 TaxID=2959627 RepID=UPI002157A83F|nr:caspase family protein [Marinoscillum sp. MHG1-6]